MKTKQLLKQVFSIFIFLFVAYMFFGWAVTRSDCRSILDSAIPGLITNEFPCEPTPSEMIRVITSPRNRFSGPVSQYEVYIILSEDKSGFRLAYKKTRNNHWYDALVWPSYYVSHFYKFRCVVEREYEVAHPELSSEWVPRSS